MLVSAQRHYQQTSKTCGTAPTNWSSSDNDTGWMQATDDCFVLDVIEHQGQQLTSVLQPRAVSLTFNKMLIQMSNSVLTGVVDICSGGRR